MSEQTLFDSLKQHLEELGASVVGCADISDLGAETNLGLPRAIIIGVATSGEALCDAGEALRQPYVDEVARQEALLGELGRAAKAFLRERGFAAEPPAAKFADDEKMISSLPRKTVATRAGLGWVGRSALLITRDFGSALRLSVTLTDAPLECGEPTSQSLCGECIECVKNCPAGAIKGSKWRPGIAREELVDVFVCLKGKNEYAERGGFMRDRYCDVCIAVCPWTKRYVSGKGRNDDKD